MLFNNKACKKASKLNLIRNYLFITIFFSLKNSNNLTRESFPVKGCNIERLYRVPGKDRNALYFFINCKCLGNVKCKNFQNMIRIKIMLIK